MPGLRGPEGKHDAWAVASGWGREAHDCPAVSCFGTTARRSSEPRVRCSRSLCSELGRQFSWLLAGRTPSPNAQDTAPLILESSNFDFAPQSTKHDRNRCSVSNGKFGNRSIAQHSWKSVKHRDQKPTWTCEHRLFIIQGMRFMFYKIIVLADHVFTFQNPGELEACREVLSGRICSGVNWFEWEEDQSESFASSWGCPLGLCLRL